MADDCGSESSDEVDSLDHSNCRPSSVRFELVAIAGSETGPSPAGTSVGRLAIAARMVKGLPSRRIGAMGIRSLPWTSMMSAGWAAETASDKES